MDIRKLRIDVDATKNGVWFNYEGDVRLKVARAGNANYLAFRATKTRELGAKIDDEDVARKVDVEAFAKCILIDWDGVQDAEGKPIPYTYEKGIEFLSDPAYDDLYRVVQNMSLRFFAYREENVRAALGNSKTSSGGSSAPVDVPAS